MKRIFIAAIVGCTMASCEKLEMPVLDNNTAEEAAPTTDEVAPVNTKLFTFHLKGAFDTSYVDMEGGEPMSVAINTTPTDEWGAVRTRAVRLDEENSANITDIWVLDYVDGALVQSVHQSSTDDDFGAPSLPLSYGTHSIKFIASRGEGATVTTTGSAPSVTWSRVKDTFVLDYPVTVSASSNGNRAPELKRCVSGVSLDMTDVIPSGTTAIKVKLSSHYSALTLPSLAVSSTASEYENSFAITAADYGQSLTLNTYSLAGTAPWTTDVTVTTYAGSAVLSSITTTGVQLKRNRLTVLRGEVFSCSGDFQVSIDDAWEADNVVDLNQ